MLAATNRDLVREVERGTFRRDLYYRLNVVSLKLAPLREREEDVIPLIDHFLGRYAPIIRFTPEALDALIEYDWPGNVRELENCIQQVVAINTGPLVHLNDLPSPVQNFMRARKASAMSMAAGAGAGPAMWNGGVPASETDADELPAPFVPDPPVLPLNEVERRAIMDALEYTNGDRAVAANLLGIGRTTLYRKLKEYRAAC